MRVGRRRKFYEVIIIPSSEEEGVFENCVEYQEAHDLMNEKFIGEHYIFRTESEAVAFIKGYKAAIGYLGDGLFYANFNTNDYEFG